MMWFMGRFNPGVLVYIIYFICGAILAVVAGIGHFRWARLASLGWSIPPALLFFTALIVSFGFLLGRGDPCPDILTSLICFVIVFLLVCMPVLRALLCFRRSHAA
jgi:hypothetical protein